jgi:uncharacterized protein
MTNTDVKKEVTITRIFDAPKELVFKAWTSPEHMRQWWGPHGFTNPVCELDAKPGGAMRIRMDAPDFPEHWMAGTFKEVVAPERLVFTARAFLDENGNGGIETTNTVLLEEINGKTKLTLHIVVDKLKPEFSFASEGMHEGWSQSLDKLIAHLAVVQKQPNYANGKICYVEIPAANIDRSVSFYKEAFGWKTRRRGDGTIAFDDATGEVSGTWVTGRKPMAEVGLLIYIMVDSVAVSLGKITAAGGTITQPIGVDAPEITARFSDPAGNIFGLYQQPS